MAKLGVSGIVVLGIGVPGLRVPGLGVSELLVDFRVGGRILLVFFK